MSQDNKFTFFIDLLRKRRKRRENKDKPDSSWFKSLHEKAMERSKSTKASS